MAKSPRAFRLKLQGRLLLLCFGSALPIATVFGLSLIDQYRFRLVEQEKLEQSTISMLTKDLDVWSRKQAADIRLISCQLYLNQSYAKDLLINLVKQHPEWAEVYSIFPDGKLIVYYPVKGIVSKPVFATGKFSHLNLNSLQSLTSIYAKSPLSGKDRLLVIDTTQIKAPSAQFSVKPVSEKLAKETQKKLLKLSSHKQKRSYQIRPSLSKINPRPQINYAGSKLVIALESKIPAKVLSNPKQELSTQSSEQSAFSTLAIADSTKTPFVYISKNKNTDKSQIEKFIPALGLYIIADKPALRLNHAVIDWLQHTVFLAFLAIFASSYLAFWASKHFSRQIKLLVKEGLALSHGDFSKRLEIKSNDELGKLAKAFNQIASKMQADHDHRRMEEKISQAIRQSLDLNQVLMATVTELGKALEVSRCCLALVDVSKTKDKNTVAHQNMELIFDYVWCDENKNGTPLNNRTLHVEENSILNMIIEQGSILSLDVMDEDGPTPLFENGKTAPEDWRSIRSVIACPITSAEGTIGLILIQQCDQLRAWSNKELELVEVVTRQLTVAMQHAHLFYYTRTMAEQEMLINQIVRCVRSSLDLDTILNTVTRELCAAIEADRCQILQPDTSGPLVVTHEYHSADLKPTKGVNLYAQEIDFNPIPVESVFSRGNFLLGIDLEKLSMRGSESSMENIKKDQPYDPWLISVINNTESDARAAAFQYFLLSSGSKSLIAAPLLNKNRIIGLLVVHQCDNQRTWRGGEIQLVSAIADQLALAVTQAALFAQVKYQAITDGLTGLYNHVYFQNRLAEELRLADRKGLPCSLLMLDLDLLKQINDTYGHPVGDAAIRQVATALKSLLRSGDTPARYGGEEFAIILPETSLLEAALIGDRLCTHIANNPVPGLGQITISVGVASYPRQAKDAVELISKADQALYEAKKSGRNQIWISDSVADSPLSNGQSVPEFRVTRRLAIAGGARKEEDKPNA